MTCLSRAASAYETDQYFQCDDHIAPLLIPGFFRLLLHLPFTRKVFTSMAAPQGIYEYVIARTKFIDAVFKQAINEGFDQILLMGAGFDTRAIRLNETNCITKIFELDTPIIQKAKINQYQKRRINIPRNLIFIPINFDHEILSEKLDKAGFIKNKRSLFVLEGLIMYLQPASVHETFQTIHDYAGDGSLILFDYVRASVLESERSLFGEEDIVRTVSRAGEKWHFGLERSDLQEFLRRYEMKLIDHKDAHDLEKEFFCNINGQTIGKVNETHCIVIARK